LRCVGKKTCGIRDPNAGPSTIPVCIVACCDLPDYPNCCKWPGGASVKRTFGLGRCGTAPFGIVCCCAAGYRCGSPAEGCVCDKPCGAKCCEKDEYCASKKHRLCCKSASKTLTAVQRRESPCIAGNEARCCPGGTRCCTGNGRADCCYPGQQCIGGRCKCTSRQTVKCGRDCCDPRTEKCCRRSGRHAAHCIPKERICCNDTSCPKGAECCEGEVCTPVGETWTCCGLTPFDADDEDCCCPDEGLVCPADAECISEDQEDKGCECA
jgi:hypothetical protein